MSSLITAWELQNRTEKELCALFRKVSQEAAQSDPGTPERRNAVASLENINRALNTRRAPQPKPPGF